MATERTRRQLLSLLRAALWGIVPDGAQFQNTDWQAVIRQAEMETVEGLLLDGIALLPQERRPGRDTIMRLYAKRKKLVAQNMLHRRTIVEMDEALCQRDITPVFMKGQLTALRYPHPLYRRPGDIDFVVRKTDFPKTMDILETMGVADRQLVHEHHGMAWVHGITVEPHYKVHNYQRPSTDRAMQAMFDEVYPARLDTAGIDGHQVHIFPPTFESVFLISHMVNHVYEEGLGLRQVIDYAVFLQKCFKDVQLTLHADWLRRMRMQRSFRIFTCLCVEYLGAPLPASIPPFTDQERRWASRLMTDIMEVGNFGRGKYVFHHRGWKDAWHNYLWVTRRCLRLGFVCPSEARWWVIAKFLRFFRKRYKKHA